MEFVATQFNIFTMAIYIIKTGDRHYGAEFSGAVPDRGLVAWGGCMLTMRFTYNTMWNTFSTSERRITSENMNSEKKFIGNVKRPSSHLKSFLMKYPQGEDYEST